MCEREAVLCHCCRLSAMTQGCMLQHVMGAAVPRSLCQRRNSRSITCTSGKTWCLAALTKICPADCSSVPLTAASQPLLLFSVSSMSPGRTVLLDWWLLLQHQCLDQLIIRWIDHWGCSGMWFILLQLLEAVDQSILVFLSSYPISKWVRIYTGCMVMVKDGWMDI